MGDLVKVRRDAMSRLTKAEVRLVSFYDAERLGEAMEMHGLTPDFLVGKLKLILDNDDDPGRQLTALAYMLKLVAEAAEKSGLVAEKRIVRTERSRDAVGEETTVADMRVMELARPARKRKKEEDDAEGEVEEEGHEEEGAEAGGERPGPGGDRGGDRGGDGGGVVPPTFGSPG